MGLIGQLLLLYSGILLLDVLLSVTLWLRRREGLNRALFLVWLATAASFVAQGLATEGAFLVTLGFSASFLVGLALSYLLGALAEIAVPWRPFVAGLGLSLLLSAAAAAVAAPFWVVALPTCLAVAAPLTHTAFRVLRAPPHPLTAAGKTLALSCFLFSAHNLDFAFLRMRPQFAALGFTIALFIVLALSITAPIVVLERMTEERVRIEQADQLHQRFFANVSHELRTPLTLILAPAERLLGRLEAGEDRTLLEVVRRNAQRLLRHVDELLDLSRLDAGGLRLNLAPLQPAALAASICDKARPTAEARGVELALAAAAPVGPILADAHRVESILTNLVANALDHTPEGGQIEVRVAEEERQVLIEVKDTGPGIPEQQLSRVFERFFQAPGVERRRGRGSGIGLALARELAELHGGSLGVRSAVGRGTTFVLSLPRGEGNVPPELVERRRQFVPPAVEERHAGGRPPAAGAVATPAPRLASPRAPARAEPARPDDLPRCRILVAEDEAEMRAFLVGLLTPSHDVIEAQDGQAALARLAEAVPDLVLSDVMMPRTGGVELCRAIKANPSWRHTPVILLTALAGSETTLEAYALGADDFVTKPFHPEVLLARVTAQLRLRSLSTQLVAREKLAAVGTLVAGVAHEVRNPLNALVNAARVLSGDNAGRPELLEVLISAAQRIEGILTVLDAHARPAEDGGVRSYDPREGLDATFTLLAHRLGGVTVERRYRSERRAVVAAGPVNQVLLNLVDNALRTGARRIVATVQDGDDRTLRVLVEDDGPGVPGPLAGRIFDPFFTTRPVGEGTGLGLYLSRQIARQNGGELRLLTESPQGAVFEVVLPTELRSARGKA